MALHKPEHTTWWYWASWLPLLISFVLVWIVCVIFKGYAWTRQGWLRDWENWVDDPVDYVKEWLHCHKLPFSYQLNISFLMNNRETTWDVIRKDGDYDNCDPEDKAGVAQ